MRLFVGMLKKYDAVRHPCRYRCTGTGAINCQASGGQTQPFCPSIENLVELPGFPRITDVQPCQSQRAAACVPSTFAIAPSIFIMSPGGANGEASVGSDGPRQKGKATPDTLS